MIDEKEFEVINILATEASTTQRELATRTQMSLGMVNILLKRLVTKGYLRAQQLDRRKIRYFLTANGLSEKARKSYRYTLKTIDSLKMIRAGIREILQEAYAKGSREFLIIGDGDLGDLTEISLRNLAQADLIYRRLPEVPTATGPASLLLLTESPFKPKSSKIPFIDLSHSLADYMHRPTNGKPEPARA